MESTAYPLVIAKGGDVRFWQIGSEVYRTSDREIAFDIYGEPMGKRWECSIEHWERSAEAVYSSWAPPVARVDAIKASLAGSYI